MDIWHKHHTALASGATLLGPSLLVVIDRPAAWSRVEYSGRAQIRRTGTMLHEPGVCAQNLGHGWGKNPKHAGPCTSKLFQLPCCLSVSVKISRQITRVVYKYAIQVGMCGSWKYLSLCQTLAHVVRKLIPWPLDAGLLSKAKLGSANCS